MANLNFNKTILGGRLTADPELKTTTNGVSVTSFSVAVNRKPQKDKEQQTDFFNVTAWRGTAEFICRYFKKGSSIFITGSLQNRSWTDNDGVKRYATDIVADEVFFVDSKGENGAKNASEGSSTTYIPDAYKTPENAPHFEEITDDDMLPF